MSEELKPVAWFDQFGLDRLKNKTGAVAYPMDVENINLTPVYDASTITALTKRAEEAERERDALRAASEYTYIGRDGRAVLARDLEDRAEAAERRLAEAERERDLLATAIAEASQKAGIYNGEVGLTGPHLLMFADDMAECILSLGRRLAEAERVIAPFEKISTEGIARAGDGEATHDNT